MKIYLIRHGESSWNRLDKIQGDSDPVLSKKGKMQAEFLARHFSDKKIEKIFTSCLRRALFTARPISKKLKVPLELTPELKEIDLGIWEGKTIEQVKLEFGNLYEKWLISPSSVTIPDAERLVDFKRRVLRAFRKIINRRTKSNIIIVTHGGVIFVLLSWMLRQKFDKVFREIRLDNAGITTVSKQDKNGAYKVLAINEIAHLEIASSPSLPSTSLGTSRSGSSQ